MTDTDAPLKKAWMNVADLIARDVQSGAFAPGTWLKQIDLEQRYGSGRPDVRRALDYLTQKRLVQHVPNRGYHVVLPDGEQTAHILELRVILETAAVDSIVANATSEAIERIEALARRFDEMILHGTVLEQYEANLAFHRELLGLCSNPELSSLVTDLRSRTSSALAGQWSTRARVEQSSREHHAMVEALGARDAQRLKDVIALHIRQPKNEGTPRQSGSVSP
ncbi:GntR family transcriptional regulator [Microvirga mediterraneensis]|uniref:GntR family transcriptional regulator n=1 Tax=Microvirga mediterraneensis TaxID=2754695 RepID=A0A838BFX4_9HYPH|nr:GntR family transcriptional regulator [Microvirga mediterraneensis]MBA1154510.1 GntR family transcriptional regulator [Microvirga mediterraneensis]